MVIATLETMTWVYDSPLETSQAADAAVDGGSLGGSLLDLGANSASPEVCPGNLQLLAARVVNKFMTEPVVNNSLMQIELTCIESNGASQIAPPPPTFQWFRRTTRGQLVFKTQTMYISEGGAAGISTPICNYSRTSMLRYTVEAADSGLGFRRQVTSQQQMTYTAHSPDYTFSMLVTPYFVDEEVKDSRV
ncbi:hypothetical protein MAR_014199 [Mya arenaria]|uniref:Ig-like domain-containing protein n=1 Tax=Mya arenaria TaxID=6604 RepID=A0ABY7G212_MYAAR|nr:hypothetical protein MAR_014199 [Mya arenaria]